jgi:hypothetical protein
MLMEAVIKELSDAYSIQSTQFNENIETIPVVSEQELLIKKSKIFLCRLNRSYLNSNICMSQLNLAIRLSKPIFLLRDSDHVIEQIENEIEMNEHSKTFNFFAGIETYLKQHIELFLK